MSVADGRGRSLCRMLFDVCMPNSVLLTNPGRCIDPTIARIRELSTDRKGGACGALESTDSFQQDSQTLDMPGRRGVDMDTGPSSAAVDTHVAWIRERLSARGIDPYAQPSLTAEVIDGAEIGRASCRERV